MAAPGTPHWSGPNVTPAGLTTVKPAVVDAGCAKTGVGVAVWLCVCVTVGETVCEGVCEYVAQMRVSAATAAAESAVLKMLQGEKSRAHVKREAADPHI